MSVSFEVRISEIYISIPELNLCWFRHLISLNFTAFTFIISIKNNIWLLAMFKSLGLYLPSYWKQMKTWTIIGGKTWSQKQNNGQHKTVIPEGGEIHEASLWYLGFSIDRPFPEERIRKGNLNRALLFHWVQESHEAKATGLYNRVSERMGLWKESAQVYHMGLSIQQFSELKQGCRTADFLQAIEEKFNKHWSIQ